MIKNYALEMLKKANATFFLFAVAFLSFFMNGANAQFANVPVTGYNADVVADGTVGAGSLSTNNDVDGGAWVFVTTTFNPGSGICSPANGVPATNQVSSLTTSGLTYTLQSYTANNSLRLSNGGNGTLTLVTPIQASNIYLLATGGSGACNITATINFSDATSQVINGSVVDWCSGTSPATAVFYRIQRTATTCSGATCQYLYDVNLPLSAANYGKSIVSIALASSGGILNVMGVGMKTPCAAPANQATLLTQGATTGTQIAGSFTAAVSTPSGYLVAGYPTGAIPVSPVDGIIYTAGQTIGSGKIIQANAATSFTAIGLTGGTAYDFYVYSYNTGATCGGPVYRTASPLTGTMSTSSCSGVAGGTYSVGPTGTYTSIGAALTAINAGITGPVILELQSSYVSSVETFPIVFPANSCIGAIKNLTIRPATGATGLSITSNNATGTINFNAANYITIDGRPGGVGTTSQLTVANTNAGTSYAIQFTADASNNVLKYCSVTSRNTSITSGTITFTTGTVTGNDGNTIDNCSITDDGTGNPVNGIYSAGTSTAIDNSGNTISNCNIANYFSASLLSSGILLTGTGNSAWTITNNKLYQTADRIYATTGNTHNGIAVLSGSGYTISGNTIGFANAAGTGTTNMIGNTVALTGFPGSYTTTGTANATRYIGINCAFTAAGTVSNIQGNTIAGFALYTSSGANTLNGIWCGINVTSGNANIGTVSGNTIGAATGAGSVYGISTTTGAQVVGIYTTSANTVSIQNNTIGAIDAMGTTTSLSGGVTGIDVTGSASYSITANNIGNTTAANIRTGYSATGGNLSNTGTLASTTGGTALLMGIRSTATGNLISINNNILRGWTESGTVTAVTGITSSGAMTGNGPIVSVNGNSLGIAASDWVNYTVANSGTLTGISLTNTVATQHSIQGNDIGGISYAASATGGHTYINLTGATAGLSIAIIANNTFTNLNVNTTGSVTFISHSYAVSSTGTQIINNNSIVTAFNKSGAGGTVTCMTSGSSSATGAICTHTNNNFSNITVTGATTITGITNTDGSGSGATRTVTGNTFNNWTGGTGAILVMNYSYFGGVSSVSNNTMSAITGQGAITGIIINVSGNLANPLTIATNSITGLSSTGTGGNVTGLTCSNTSPVVNINNNTINTLSSTGASSTVLGLGVTGATLTGVFQNTINTLSGTGATSPICIGLSVSSGTTVNVYKNKVYDILESGAITTTSPSVSGLLLSGGTTVNAYNNYIGDLRTPVAGLTDAIRGINITSASTSTNYNLYYNTVYLNTSSSNGTFGTTGIFHTISTTTTTAKLDLRNNIIVNTSTPGATSGLTAAYRRSGGAASNLANYASTSNNNLFYAGAPSASNLIYSDGTSTAQTISSYKYGAFTAGTIGTGGRDVNSVSENPNWLSTIGANSNFLHINATIATQIESGGQNIATYTDDYDGDIRQGNVGYAGTGNAPDIGADEFNGIASDQTPPIIAYTNIGAGAVAPTQVFNNITATDINGVNGTIGTRPRVYYKKSTDANNYVDNTSGTNGWKYAEATNAVSPFNFVINYSLLNGGAGVSVADVIQYFVTAQDNAPVPNVGINSGVFTAIPSSVALTAAAFPVTGTINSFTIAPTFSGVKTVCFSGCDYATLTVAGGAFAAINGNVVTGNLILQIAGDLTSETGAVALNEFASPYTVTIVPTGAPRIISGAIGTGGLIKLNGADRVTIDGSLSAGTDRSLTITNTTATTTGNAVIWLASPASGNGALNNTIKNCTIQGNSSTTTFTGMYVGGNATVSLTAAGTEQNNSNTITNNLFLKTQYGLVMFGYGTGTPDNNNVVSNNNFGTAVAGEGFSIEAIHTDRQTSLIVSGNDVQNVKGTSGTTMYGIRLLDFKNGLAYNNKVHNLNYSGASTNKLYGMAVQSSSFTTAGNPSQAQIYNNMVYDITSNGNGGTWNTTGILANQGYGDKYYFNSVSLNGQIANSSSGLCAAFANGDANITTTGTNIDVRNNVFSLTGSSATAGGQFWAYYTAITSFTGYTQSNNDLYCAGTGATNNVGRFNGNNYTTMATWQAASTVDANSNSVDPQFTSATDLHIPAATTTRLESGGVAVGITTDIDGQVRPGPAGSVNGGGTAPDLGADEFDGTPLSANDMSATAFTYPLNGGTILAIISFTPQASFTNSGLNAQTNVTVRYRIINAGNVEVYNQTAIIASIASGITTTVTFPSGSIPSAGNYTIKAKAELAGDQVAVNDEITGSIVGATPLCGTYHIGTAQSAPYNTLTNAVAAINSLGASCAVSFLLDDASYSASETFPITINAFPGASASNTLTIKPNTGNSATITGNSATTILKLNGASYITIDGSNSGGTDKSLTINNTNVTSPCGIWLSSLGLGAGAANNTIKNCNITVSANSTGYGIAVSGATVISSGSDNDNVTLQNNAITNTSIGIYAIGTAAVSTGGLDNLSIIGNSITTNTSASPDYGIELGNCLNASVNQNTLSIQTSATIAPSGISLETGFINSVVNKNVLTNVSSSATNGYGGRAIVIGTGTATSGLTISNNVIYGVNGTNWTGILNSSAMGIAIGVIGNATVGTTTTGGINIYNNSINLTGNFLSGGFAGATLTADIYIGSAVTGLDIRNNIFANLLINQNAGGTASKNYAIYCTSANTAFTNINYNNYYVSGTQGVLGIIGGTDKTTLSAWIAASGQDKGSVSAIIPFISNTDLHIDNTATTCWNVNGRGIAIPSVGTDVEGNIRSTTVGVPTDIGAYEFNTATTPDDAVEGGTRATNSTSTYTSGGKRIAEITWGASGTVPTAVSFKYYPGVTPASVGATPVINSYSDIQATGGSGYTYTIKYYYTPAEQSAINDNLLSIIKRNLPAAWVTIPSAAFATDATYGNYIASASPLNSFSQFSLENNSVPLAVKLLSVSGTNEGSRNRIDWATGTESTGDKFSIERSTDGIEFTELGNVNAKGKASSYSYYDETPVVGMNHYRIKMLEANGAVSYSATVHVMVNNKKGFSVYAYPNPVKEVVTVKLNGTPGSNGQLQLTDVTGKLNRVISMTGTEMNIDLHDLTPGMYLLKYTDDSHTEVLKLNKQ